MFNVSRFMGTFDKQHDKWDQNLLKYQQQHL